MVVMEPMNQRKEEGSRRTERREKNHALKKENNPNKWPSLQPLNITNNNNFNNNKKKKIIT